MSASNKGTALGCMAAILVLALIPVSYLVNGWVLSILWGWFVVPLFEWVPVLTTVQAIGLAIIVGFLTHQVKQQHYRDDRSSSEKTTDMLTSVLYLVFGPLVILGVGWIVYQFT